MEINKNTRISDILDEYGDIADVMEIFGVKRVARYSFRRMLTKVITVETAARVHGVPLDEFLVTVRQAVGEEKPGPDPPEPPPVEPTPGEGEEDPRPGPGEESPSEPDPEVPDHPESAPM